MRAPHRVTSVPMTSERHHATPMPHLCYTYYATPMLLATPWCSRGRRRSGLEAQLGGGVSGRQADRQQRGRKGWSGLRRGLGAAPYDIL